MTWPIYSNLTEILSRWSFRTSLMMIGLKLWPLECSQGFCMIWPTDLVSDQIWPIFKLDWDFVKMNQNCGLYSVHKVFPWFDLLTLFLTQHHPYSNLLEILARWSFWARLMKIGLKLRSLDCSQGFFEVLTYWLRFWHDMTYIRTWPRYCQDDHSEQVLWWLNQNCDLWSVHKVFLWFDLLT